MVSPTTGMILAGVQITLFLAYVAAKDVPVMVTILFHSTRTFQWDKDEDMTIGQLKTWMLDQREKVDGRNSDIPIIKCEFTPGAHDGKGIYWPDTTQIKKTSETIPSLTNTKHHILQMDPKGEIYEIPSSYLSSNGPHMEMTIIDLKKQMHAQKLAQKRKEGSTLPRANIYFTPGAHGSKYFPDETKMKELPNNEKVQFFTRAVSESE